MESKKKSLISVHIAVLLFGFSGLFGKLVVLPAVLISLGRVFFSSIFLFLMCRRRKIDMRLRSRRDYILAIGAGAVLAVHWTTFLQSIQMSTVAVGTLTFSTFPLFLTFLEPYFFHEKLRLRNVICAVIMLAGVMLIVPEFEMGNQMTRGVFMGMAGSLSYAVLSLFNRTLSVRYPGSLTALYEQGSAVVFLFPAFILIRPSITARDWLGLLVLGIVFTAAAHTMYIDSLKHIKAQTAGIISSLESVYGIAAAFLFLKEIPNMKELLGGIIILGVVFYSTMASAKESEAVKEPESIKGSKFGKESETV